MFWFVLPAPLRTEWNSHITSKRLRYLHKRLQYLVTLYLFNSLSHVWSWEKQSHWTDSLPCIVLGHARPGECSCTDLSEVSLELCSWTTPLQEWQRSVSCWDTVLHQTSSLKHLQLQGLLTHDWLPSPFVSVTLEKYFFFFFIDQKGVK